ncbi:RNA polymerase sigma-70 factor [Carboxylicivirga mesophila]|uniref:RNA polymerase sigma-70 factor n=1 Tax=Carboxylicivirga mesophila TaxID=1166478 RepID=A0ABS5KB75_9BACT|nr:RNA polymerase sigma-70 factor [Carboxylicivirga mesophila]
MGIHEEDTIRRLKKGDDQAFELLYHRYFRKLCAFTNKYLNDYEATQEVVQEVFYSIWKNRADLNAHKSITAYLFQLAKNKSLNIIKHSQVEDKYLNVIKSAYLQGDFVDTHDSLLAKEIDIKTQEVIDSLPAQCRKIFLMSRHEGKKHKEIAEELNISVKTVETQIGRALKVFRKELKEYLTTVLLTFI